MVGKNTNPNHNVIFIADCLATFSKLKLTCAAVISGVKISKTKLSTSMFCHFMVKPGIGPDIGFPIQNSPFVVELLVLPHIKFCP